MNYMKELKCLVCGRSYDPRQIDYTCPSCGLEGNLTVIYDYESLRKSWQKEDLLTNKDYTIWRYLPLLPVQNPIFIPPGMVGATPLYHFSALAEKYGCGDIAIKDEGRNPTASLKDRPSVMAIVKAQEKNASVVTCASTGNAASSLACASASVGLPCVIFVPERTPKAKLAQLLVFGAKVIMVKGSYDQAFDLCLRASDRFGWYSRNTGYNPYLREGKKTFALELCEQLNWTAPDKVFLSVGDGNTLSGGWKGFTELYHLGWIPKLPKMIAIQAEGASPVAKAFQSGGTIEPEIAETVADSIAVGRPRDGRAALKAIRESEGDALTVTDTEILNGLKQLARETGIFAEPSAAAAYAGFLKYAEAGKLAPEERVAIMITGSGLKDIDGAMKSVSEAPMLIEPDEKELDRLAGLEF
jgi:threonine synthase